MDLILLADRVHEAATLIDAGRKGFAIRGKAEESRLFYEEGISIAMTAFQEAQNAADPQALILAEYTFITQEFELCDKNDKYSIDSLTKAIESFKDAILALQAVGEPCYKISDKTFPHNGKYRVSDYPKDAYHIACIAPRTRLQNILRSPGIDPIEKSLLIQRHANLAAAQAGYIEKQKKAMAIEQ